MAKKGNTYQLSLQLVSLASGEAPAQEKSTKFLFDNHDELFGIIEKVQNKNIFNNKQQAAEFAIGLKMFSEVMLKHRNYPLFEELLPAFGSFMKRLKTS